MGCKPISIPLEQNVKLSADEGNLMEDTTMYRRIVGSLIYKTRHKAIFELCNWSGESIHANTMKATFGCSEVHTYINRTLQCGIFYEAKNQLQVHGYTDVDWAGNVSKKNQPMVSFYFLEVVLLVGVIKNNQHLHY